MKLTVLLVDDDKLVMQFYVKALRKHGFKVIQTRDPDATFKFVEKKPDLSAIILDIMMSPGEVYRDKDTEDGLLTGLFLYEDLKTRYQHAPFVVLTNVLSNPKTQEAIQRFQGDPLLKVVRKLDYPPHELAQLTKRMIDDLEPNPSS